MRDVIQSDIELRTLLRRHRINPTRQRIDIARALFSDVEHVSADAILMRVNATHPLTSKATVYNTLNLFVQRGLLREVIAHPNKVFYDANTAPHYHFYDVDTGELMDIPAEELPVARLPQLPPGKVTEGLDIVIRIRSACTES